MKISGTSHLPVPVEQAYDMMQDPEVLAKCIPGCESLERTGENEFAMRMKTTLASISGKFEGKVRIADQNPPNSFRLIVETAGKIGFVNGDGLLSLTHASQTATVTFEGEVHVGGVIANVGQRLIQTTAKMLTKRFFDSLAAQGGQRVNASGASGGDVAVQQSNQ